MEPELAAEQVLELLVVAAQLSVELVALAETEVLVVAEERLSLGSAVLALAEAEMAPELAVVALVVVSPRNSCLVLACVAGPV